MWTKATLPLAVSFTPVPAPRTHVPSTGHVVGFHLVKRFLLDHFNKRYLLVGCVGEILWR